MKRREIRERDEAAERERLEARTEGLLAQLRANEVARNAPDASPTADVEPAAGELPAEAPPVSTEPESADEPAKDPEMVGDDPA